VSTVDQDGAELPPDNNTYPEVPDAVGAQNVPVVDPFIDGM
jgi:hypothetical protein